jgi:TonB family protein
MTPGPRPTGRRASRFLGLSVVGHALFFVVIGVTGMGRSCQVPSSIEGGMGASRGAVPIDVTMIEPTVLNPYASRPTDESAQAEIEKKLEEARKPEEDRNVEGQVVDVGKPDVEIRPEEARFLSEYDTKVEKETKGKPGMEAAGARERREAAAQPPSRATPAQPEVAPVEAEAPRKGQGGAGGKGTLAMRSLPTPGQGDRGKEEGLESSADEGSEARRGAAGEGEGEPRQGAPGEERPGIAGSEGQEASPGTADLPQVSDLRPSDEMLSRAVGVGSSDYLKDIDEGADTLLNTKRWKYASFFTRVKRGVAQSWRPDAAYRLRDPTGQIYGQKNRFTVLKVSLAPDGSLRDVMVEKPCGVDFLDDEAVTAFREAQPFPNPPPGLVDPESHLITFRFGFYFEISGAPKFRVFRQ